MNYYEQAAVIARNNGLCGQLDDDFVCTRPRDHGGKHAAVHYGGAKDGTCYREWP